MRDGRPATLDDVGGGGAARRLPATLELGAGGVHPRPGTLGPYGGRVRVVPIDGLSRNAVRAIVPDPSSTRGVIFEVCVEWYGPGLPELPPTGRRAEVTDVCAVGDQALAEAIARGAAELLQSGRLPWLRHLQRAMVADRAAWRRRYASEFGEADRLA
jgi:hypothetical protein